MRMLVLGYAFTRRGIRQAWPRRCLAAEIWGRRRDSGRGNGSKPAHPQGMPRPWGRSRRPRDGLLAAAYVGLFPERSLLGLCPRPFGMSPGVRGGPLPPARPGPRPHPARARSPHAARPWARRGVHRRRAGISRTPRTCTARRSLPSWACTRNRSCCRQRVDAQGGTRASLIFCDAHQPGSRALRHTAPSHALCTKLFILLIGWTRLWL